MSLLTFFVLQLVKVTMSDQDDDHILSDNKWTFSYTEYPTDCWRPRCEMEKEVQIIWRLTEMGQIPQPRTKDGTMGWQQCSVTPMTKREKNCCMSQVSQWLLWWGLQMTLRTEVKVNFKLSEWTHSNGFSTKTDRLCYVGYAMARGSKTLRQ